MAGCIGDLPVAGAPRDGVAPLIFDGDRIGPHVVVLPRLRLALEILRADDDLYPSGDALIHRHSLAQRPRFSTAKALAKASALQPCGVHGEFFRPPGHIARTHHRRLLREGPDPALA